MIYKGWGKECNSFLKEWLKNVIEFCKRGLKDFLRIWQGFDWFTIDLLRILHSFSERFPQDWSGHKFISKGVDKELN